QALRAEEVVDPEAHVGERGQRQDPAQRGHGRALLQHDPHRQHGDVEGPGQGEAGFPGGAEFGQVHAVGSRRRKAVKGSDGVANDKRAGSDATGTYGRWVQARDSEGLNMIDQPAAAASAYGLLRPSFLGSGKMSSWTSPFSTRSTPRRPPSVSLPN